MSGAVNDPNRAPYVRAPRLQVLIDGNPIPGAEEASWHSTSHFAPDTWSARFATGADQRYGLQWWDKLDVPTIVDIQVGLASPNGSVQWTSLGQGQIDDLSAAPDQGAVTISGRDLGALMLEETTAESFQNQTASEIVKKIAARHGLTADVAAAGTVPFSAAAPSTPTPAPPYPPPPEDGPRRAKEILPYHEELMRRFYQTDHTVETHNAASPHTNEGDLMVKMAQAEGFSLYLTGKTLHFVPLPLLTDKPYVVVWNPATVTAASPQSNGINLRLDHKLMLAKPVTVTVKSFHSRQGVTVKATASSPGAKTGGVVAGNVFTQGAKKAKQYNFLRPNLTQAQADAMAKQMLADITRHERNISWSEPATITADGTLITPRNVALLSGTNTDFDQAYYIDTVSTSINFDAFGMDITAKSMSSATEQAIQSAAG